MSIESSLTPKLSTYQTVILESLVLSKKLYLRLLVINIIITSLVIMFLIDAVMPSLKNYAVKAKVSEALTIVTEIKTSLTHDYFQSGIWPKEFKEEFGNSSTYLSSFSFDGNGSINMTFNNQEPQLSNKVLSFRVATIQGIEISNILWVCGYASPPKGFSLKKLNLTNIDKKHLPSTCR